MTSEQIRDAFSTTEDLHAAILAEIAAQLAEINEHLAVIYKYGLGTT